MSNHNVTKIGLIFFIIGIIMQIIATAIFFFVDIFNSMATLSLGIVSGIGAILIFVALILIWVAGMGLKEYGQKHSKFCLISLILFFVAIGVILALTLGQGVMMAGAMINGDYSGFKNFYLIAPVGSVFTGLVYVFLLHEIEDKYGKILLYASFITLIVVSSVIAYIGYAGFDEWSNSVDLSSDNFLMQGSLSSYNSFSQAIQQRSYQLNVFSIIPNSMILVSAILPLYRICSGKLIKVPKKNYPRVCPHCGMPILEQSNFCTNCGARF